MMMAMKGTGDEAPMPRFWRIALSITRVHCLPMKAVGIDVVRSASSCVVRRGKVPDRFPLLRIRTQRVEWHLGPFGSQR